MNPLIRVAIADDHQGIIDGYLYRLSSEPDIEVIGTAFYGDDIEKILSNHEVDGGRERVRVSANHSSIIERVVI